MTSARPPRGLFVALEGIDGSGTTTQAQLLEERLRRAGRVAHVTREPSDGAIGRLLREVLRGGLELPAAGTALLFAADRLHHLAHEILPRVEAGEIVITDRYLLSSLAYQGLQCALDWVEAINRHAVAPDLTVFLRIDPQRAAARRASRGAPEEIFEGDLFQRRVAARYDELLAPEMRAATWALVGETWQRAPSPRPGELSLGDVAVIEGDAPVETIHGMLYGLVEALGRAHHEEDA